MRRGLHILAVLAALPGMLSGLLGGSTVLCIGPEGHVAIEPASATDRCCPQLAADVDEESGSRSLGESCGSCTDTPFFSTLISSHGRERPHVAAPGLELTQWIAPMPELLVAIVPSSRAGVPPDVPFGGSSASLRCIVLLV